MLALQLSAVNQLGVVEVPDPKPAANEAVVAIRAAALNHRDVWIKAGQYAGLKWPCVPGSDGAGTVVAIGANGDTNWLNREVVVNPSFGWGEREQVQGSDFSILGLPRDGTFAQNLVVPVTQLAIK